MRRSYWKNTAPYDAILALIVALLAWLAASITHGQITLTVVPGSGTFGKVLDATKYCTPTLTAYGGGTGSQTSVLATGWNTVALTLTAANMAPDGNGDFVRLSGSNIYFTEAVVDQN